MFINVTIPFFLSLVKFEIKMKKSVFLLSIIPLLFLFSCKKENPKVEIMTTKGLIIVELDIQNAPITAGHFLKLVEKGVYDGGSFYRSVRGGTDENNPVPIRVVQGGAARKKGGEKIETIPHETTQDTGLKHLNMTVSMARGEPGTASTEFFICMHDEPELDFGGRRNPDGQGFAAFGRVIVGEDIVHKVWGSPAMGEQIDPVVPIHKIKVK